MQEEGIRHRLSTTLYLTFSARVYFGDAQCLPFLVSWSSEPSMPCPLPGYCVMWPRKRRYERCECMHLLHDRMGRASSNDPASNKQRKLRCAILWPYPSGEHPPRSSRVVRATGTASLRVATTAEGTARKHHRICTRQHVSNDASLKCARRA